MTLPQLEVDLAGCFEAGQLYVALSRAVSLQQTRLLSFDPRKVRTNHRVVAFHDALEARARASAAPRDDGGGAAAASPFATAAAAAGFTGGGSATSNAAGVVPGGGGAPVSTLTPEQRARMEASKAAALARRRSG